MGRDKPGQRRERSLARLRHRSEETPGRRADDCLPGPGGAALQVLLNLREDRPNGGAEQQQDTNDDDGNQRDDEGILDQTLAATAMEETIQHVFGPFGGDVSAAMPRWHCGRLGG